MTVGEKLEPLVSALLGDDLGIRITFWDGSALGTGDGPAQLQVSSPAALTRMMWAPGELGLARAFVSGELNIDGDIVAGIAAVSDNNLTAATAAKTLPLLLPTLRSIGAIGTQPAIPDIEYRPPLIGAHTLRQDAAAISHHYDVSNEFYELVLGSSMTYSCARFVSPNDSLESAQAAKHDNICRKLGLDHIEDARLLDVGCGWGSMAIHAAKTYGAQVLGVTISEQQAEMARQRVAAAGVSKLVEIRLQDYREISDGDFDAISSIGMSEHVGKANLPTYFVALRERLKPTGRLLNHAISSIGGSRLSRNSFMYRYIFPDGELIDIGDSLDAMQEAGFEIRDVESRREHYALTLRRWIANLEGNWDRAVDIVGEQRARAWRLYMAASVVGFTDAGLNLHQALGVVNAPDGTSGVPLERPV